MIELVEKILDMEVRPHLKSHDGDIRVVSLEGGVLKVQFLGMCSGCPSADITNEEIVKDALLGKIPELKDVALVSNISQDMWDLAHKILNRNQDKRD